MALQPQIEQIAAAFERQDYKTAAQLLKQLTREAPGNLWVQLYTARLQEAAGKLEVAESNYRKLLQRTTSAKIALQARQGLQRLEAAAQARRQEAIARATADPAQAGLGFLVLEPMSAEAKQATLHRFAQMMKLDPYTARIHLSHRGWKLYRTGAIGELQMYGEDMRSAGIPAFWVPLAAIQQIQVFRIQYLQTLTPEPTIICQNEENQLGSLTFNWSEVSNQVEGMLPIFEEVVYLGAWNRLKRKEQTQDYAQVLDLHLPKRGCILRFFDSSYQFQQGIALEDGMPSSDSHLRQLTNRLQWNQLIHLIRDRLSGVPLWSDFTPFAETALEHLDLAGQFSSHTALFRREESPWDKAFHLYSGLIFKRTPGGKDQ